MVILTGMMSRFWLCFCKWHFLKQIFVLKLKGVIHELIYSLIKCKFSFIPLDYCYFAKNWPNRCINFALILILVNAGFLSYFIYFFNLINMIKSKWKVFLQDLSRQTLIKAWKIDSKREGQHITHKMWSCTIRLIFMKQKKKIGEIELNKK